MTRTAVVQTFFEAMSKEDNETQMSVQEALSLMAVSCRQMAPNNLAMLETMLGAYIDDSHAQVNKINIFVVAKGFHKLHFAAT